MKFIAVIFLLIAPLIRATEIKDIEMFGYARAGVGTNTYGGDQECFYNQGAGGWGGIGRNEFRLGNECSNYLELGTKFNHLKGESKWAYTQLRLANSHNGSDSTESKSQSTNFVELFAEAYGLNNIPASFWIGKRFYREQDVYVDDFYYFGAMSGNGGGISHIKIFDAELSFAYLRKVDDESTSPVTSNGKPGITVLDTRLKNLKITTNLNENFWMAYGYSKGGTDNTSHVEYGKTDGFVVGTLLDYNLNNAGFNHFSILYGHGLMNDFNLYGSSTVQLGTDLNKQNETNRLRFINHTTYKLNEKLQGHLSLSHEHVYNKFQSAEQWTSMTLRPMYIVTDNFQMVTEAGGSVVCGGGVRKLVRLTAAPQLSLNTDIWGRPVFRAFYTHSFWNEENKSNIAQNAKTYANKTSGGAYGLQMETFF